MEKKTYLDYAASTPLDPRAAEAISRAMVLVGNPSSVHGQGRAVRAVIEKAREQVAAMVDVPASSVTFTSGASEANLLAILGFVSAVRRTHPNVRPRILCGPTEHTSVTEAVRRMEAQGMADVAWLPVDSDGVVRAEELRTMLTDDVMLVAMQWANNVTGVLQPVEEVGKAVRNERARRGGNAFPVTFLCDAVQAARTQDLRPFTLGVDMLTLSAHKIYGPKGVGALIRRPGLALDPVAVGGGQEDGLRAGTENVLGIAGFGAAAAILVEEKEKDIAHAAMLHRLIRDGLAKAVGDRVVPLVTAPTVPDILYVAGRGVDERAVFMLDASGIAVSTGSACDAGKRKASHVIAAMGRGGISGIRVSFGRGTDVAAVTALTDALAAMSR